MRGVYEFHITVYGFGDSSTATEAVLMKNGQPVVIAYGHQPSHRVNSCNTASLLLEKGDVIFVHLRAGFWVRDSGNKHTTFDGHLLFTV